MKTPPPEKRLLGQQLLGWLAFSLPGLFFCCWLFSPWSAWVSGRSLRLLLLSLPAVLGAWVWRRFVQPRSTWPEAFLTTLLVYTFMQQIAAWLPEISTYPWSLGWSEASRYYYASLFFAEQIYGDSAALSVLHPSRYLMQALPFLWSNELWLHRLWQVFLWFATTIAAAGGLTWRLKQDWRFTIWSVLFIFQGPVYYHLLIIVMLVLWGVRLDKPWRTLFVIALGSTWGGISRVNWIPMAGVLAAVVYLLETPRQGRPLWRYALTPAFWAFGGALLGWLAQSAYVVLSGNPANQFHTSLSSDLLWYRLLPNATYREGVLLDILVVSLPLVWLSWNSGVLAWRGHFWRTLALLAALGVFFAGSIVVSVKIGGGGDLHNMDAFLVLLWLVGAYLFYGFRAEPDFTPPISAWFRPRLQPLLLAAVVLVPVWYGLRLGGAWPQRDFAAAEAEMIAFKQIVLPAAQRGERILFITQRHLLAFNQLPEVALIPDYEVVFLMEMAMARHPEYLGEFQRQLATHQFDWIVTEPLRVAYQGRNHPFGEENNLWVAGVSEPVLCYYQLVQDFTVAQVQILAPRSQDCR